MFDFPQNVGFVEEFIHGHTAIRFQALQSHGFATSISTHHHALVNLNFGGKSGDKAGYTATVVADGWGEAENQKGSFSKATNGPIDGRTDRD